MSQSSVYFHHEGLNGCRTINDYKKKVEGCGDCSTGLMSLGVDMTSGARIVVIEKNDEELERCIDWCNKTYELDSKDFILELDSRLLTVDALRIKQSEINDRLEDIWCYLVGDPWDDKYKKLVDFNIQVQSTEIDNYAARALYESIQ